MVHRAWCIAFDNPTAQDPWEYGNRNVSAPVFENGNDSAAIIFLAFLGRSQQPNL